MKIFVKVFGYVHKGNEDTTGHDVVLMQKELDTKQFVSFRSFIQQCFPVFNWQHEDGEDWFDDSESDYCLYTAETLKDGSRVWAEFSDKKENVYWTD